MAPKPIEQPEVVLQTIANRFFLLCQQLPDPSNSSALREWWYEILRTPGHYSCYAFFLGLPSDKEAIRYITEFGKELDLISGNNCLIIALGKDEVKCFDLEEEIWNATIKNYISEGYSVEIAQRF
ncbi:MAG: hypothetical protein GY797_32925, partial [Deltaproteobacteria bacterium]|nr:hypothetical protein [Deltaproteobacteria bacterium]